MFYSLLLIYQLNQISKYNTFADDTIIYKNISIYKNIESAIRKLENYLKKIENWS